MNIPTMQFTNGELGLICAMANRSSVVQHFCDVELKRLPTVEQAIEAMSEQLVAAELTAWGKEKAVTIIGKLKEIN